MKISHIIGSRANLVKLSPVYREALLTSDVSQEVLTIDGYQESVFSKEEMDFFGIRNFEHFVNIESTGYIENISEISKACFDHFLNSKSDYIFVYGDIYPTLATTIAAVKADIMTVHIEAGLRNGNWYDQEEIHRIAVDHLADYLTPIDQYAKSNLVDEGFDQSRFLKSGNLVIDTISDYLSGELSWEPKEANISGEYGVFTLHRIENLMSRERLTSISNSLQELSKNHKLICIMSQTTKEYFDINGLDIWNNNNNLILKRQQPYWEFINIIRHASFVLTDSSTLQDETTYLNIPCFVCLNQTHRDTPLNHGTTTLVGTSQEQITNTINSHDSINSNSQDLPPGWDGQSAERLIDSLKSL